MVHSPNSIDMKDNDKLLSAYMKKYEKAKSIRQRWEPLFNECYEYALPMRETFYSTARGERRDERMMERRDERIERREWAR